MIPRLRRGLTYSNVMATIAVFLALGGAAYALARNSVKGRHIAADAVKAGKHIAGADVLGAVGREADPGETVPIAKHGPMSLVGRCFRQSGAGANVEAQVELRTRANGTRYALYGHDLGEHDKVFDALPDDAFTVLDVPPGTATLTATAGTNPGSGYLDAAYLLAIAPGGAALHGYIGGGANVHASDKCVFLADGLG